MFYVYCLRSFQTLISQLICVCVDIQEGNLEIFLDGRLKEGFLIFTGGVVLIYLASWFPNGLSHLSLVIASRNSFRGLFSVSL